MGNSIMYPYHMHALELPKVFLSLPKVLLGIGLRADSSQIEECLRCVGIHRIRNIGEECRHRVD